MFIRRTQTRSTAGGEVYFTHRSCTRSASATKCANAPAQSRPDHFEVARNDWPALTRRIDELLAGQLALPRDGSPALESHAQRITAQLLAAKRRHHSCPTSQGRDLQPLTSIRWNSFDALGRVEHVALWAMDQLGLRTRLQEPGIGASLCAAAVGSIVARMAQPGSERAARAGSAT